MKSLTVAVSVLYMATMVIKGLAMQDADELALISELEPKENPALALTNKATELAMQDTDELALISELEPKENPALALTNKATELAMQDADELALISELEPKENPALALTNKATVHPCYTETRACEKAAQCELVPYKALSSTRLFLQHLDKVMNYSKKKENEFDMKKKSLDKLLKETAGVTTKLDVEKRKKETKTLPTLTKTIAGLSKKIPYTTQAISNTNARISENLRHISNIGRQITLQDRRANQLKSSIRSKGHYIRRLDNEIRRQREKQRRCLGRKRSVRVKRWGFIGKAFEHVGRAVDHVVSHIPIVCKVWQAIKSLIGQRSRAKEQRNQLYRQLRQLQHHEAHIKRMKRNLLNKRAGYNRYLTTLIQHLRNYKTTLASSVKQKIRTKYDICMVTARINQLHMLLGATKKKLTEVIRLKTKTHEILHGLGLLTIDLRLDKKDGINANKTAGVFIDPAKEEEELTRRGVKMKEYVSTLTSLTCDHKLELNKSHDDITRIIKMKPTSCGRAP